MNVWNNFWKSLNLRRNSSWKDIRTRFSDSDAPKCSLSQKFMALAYLDSQSSDPSKVESMKKIADGLGFDYSNFYNAKNFEKELLERFSIVLLRSSDGSHRQFMRTIRRLSGKMYVEFADKIGTAIREHGWSWISDPQHLNTVLEVPIERYGANKVGLEETFKEGLEETLSKADTAKFFLTLINLYRKYNQPFSPRDILATDLGQVLTPGIAESIIKKMCVEKVSSLTELDDTMPIIELQNNKNAVISLPEIGKFNGKSLVKVVFQFFSTASAEKPVCFCRYENNQGQWKRAWQIGWSNGVGLEKHIRCIKKVKLYSDNRQETSDVTPQILNGYSFILFSVNTEKVVTDTEELERGCRYKLVPLDDGEIKVYALVDENENVLTSDENGFFTVPQNAEQITINDKIYDTTRNRYTWINKDERFKGIINGSVGRLFFERSALLLTEEAYKSDIQVSYKLDNEETVEFPKEDDIPDDFLWQSKGRLIICKEGNKLVSLPVTFIPDVDQDDLKMPINYGESKKVSIKFIEDVCPPIPQIDINIDGKSLRVEFEYKGFKFALPVLRKGIYLQHKNSKILLPLKKEQPDEKYILEVADEDFERFFLAVELVDDDRFLKIVRGTAFHDFIALESKKETLQSYCAKIPEISEHESDYYSIIVGSGDDLEIYKLHRYDTLSADYFTDESNGKSFSYKLTKDKNDCCLSYFVSYCDSEREKVILVYKTTHQEERPVEIKPYEVKHETDEHGRCVETLHFKIDDNLNNCGKICFAAYKKINALKYKIVSSGFFLKSDGCPETPNDELFDLRLALADKNTEKICSIMMTEDEALRERIKKFIETITLNAQNAGICEYMNSFRNKLIIKNGLMEIIPSGYLFMAGWFFSGQIDEKGKFNADYRDYWDPLMIAYKYMTPPRQPDIKDIDAWLKNYREFINKMENKRDIIEKLRGLMSEPDNKGECNFPCCCFFSFPQLSEAVRRMENKYNKNNDAMLDFPEFMKTEMPDVVKLFKKEPWAEICMTILLRLFSAWRTWRPGTGECVPRKKDFYEKNKQHFDALSSSQFNFIVKYLSKDFLERNNEKYLYHVGYDQELSKKLFSFSWFRGFSIHNLHDFIKEIANELHEWRKNPDLKTAQKLREVLLTIQVVDNELLFYLQSVTDIKTNDFIGLRKVIDSVAWDLYYEEKKLKTEVC